MKNIIYIFIFLFFSLPSYGNTLSWSINNSPSLLITDLTGVVYTNNSIMVDTNSTTNKIRIEDVFLEKGYKFSNVFVRFDKKSITSFVRVKLYDVFTDTLVYSHDFIEQKVDILSNNLISHSRVYMVVELFGNDIELRSAGVGMDAQNIVDKINLNKTILDSSQDNLVLDFSLNESARVTLLIYDRNGNIVEKILVNKILDIGEYEFIFDPKDLSFDYLGDKRYYTWLKASNNRSSTVELIEKFFIIPK